jgi:hypothetical protein
MTITVSTSDTDSSFYVCSISTQSSPYEHCNLLNNNSSPVTMSYSSVTVSTNQNYGNVYCTYNGITTIPEGNYSVTYDKNYKNNSCALTKV